MNCILSRQFLGGKYSKWIVILQEFDLEFIKSKSKKSFFLVELLYDLPYDSTATMSEPSIPDESLFLIGSYDPWYGDFIIYLYTQTFGHLPLTLNNDVFNTKPKII